MTFSPFKSSSFWPQVFLICVLSFLFSNNIISQSPQKESSDKDTLSLKRCWSIAIPEDGVAAMIGNDKNTFVASSTGQILSIENGTGNRNWTTDLGGRVISNLFVFRSKVYVATNSVDGGGITTLRALSLETGITIWSSKITVGKKIYIGSDDRAIFIVGNDGTINRLDAETGSVSWDRKINAEVVTVPIFSTDAIIFGTSDKHIYILDPENGVIKTLAAVISVPVFVSGSVKNGIIFGGDRGNLTKWTSDSAATSWRFKAGAKVTHAFRTDEGILAGSDDNFIYMISDYNGDVIWKLRMSGRVINLIILSDNLAAASAVGEKQVVVFDLGKGKPQAKIDTKQENSIISTFISSGESAIVSVNNFDIEFLSLNGCPGYQTN